MTEEKPKYISYKEAIRLANKIHEDMEHDRKESERRDYEYLYGPNMHNVLMINGYDGWRGMLEVPVELNLSEALEEFRSKYFANIPYDNLNDEWWNTHLKQVEDLKSTEGFAGYDFESLFIDWLCREKKCEKIEFETFNIDSWKQYDLDK